jgi:hypothetical protein
MYTEAVSRKTPFRLTRSLPFGLSCPHALPASAAISAAPQLIDFKRGPDGSFVLKQQDQLFCKVEKSDPFSLLNLKKTGFAIVPYPI